MSPVATAPKKQPKKLGKSEPKKQRESEGKKLIVANGEIQLPEQPVRA